MSAAFSFDPKGQRIPAQGATLGMGWRVSVRDTDGGYGSGTRTVGMHPGHRWCVWMRSEGAAHRSGAASVGCEWVMRPSAAFRQHAEMCAA
jgi:hypothetical protein